MAVFSTVRGIRAKGTVLPAAGPFYGFNRPGATVSEGTIRNWSRQGMMGAANAPFDCVKAFSEPKLRKT